MRLEVTRKSDLAVRVLRALDDGGRRMKAGELADRVASSAGFISQIAKLLVDAGWLRSDPGPSGGYVLAVDLAELSVLAVIEAVEGPTETGQCVLVNRACDDAGKCTLHDAWVAARAELLGELGRRPVSASHY